MVSTLLTEQGECLYILGLLNQAEEVYKRNIELNIKLDNVRRVVANKYQLAIVHFKQKKFPAALQGYYEALGFFHQYNDTYMIAMSWHQIGHVYKALLQFKEGESAYRQSLSVMTQQKKPMYEAISLNSLAVLYDDRNRLEEAVGYYQRAATIFSKFGDVFYEGLTRNNLANTLIKLKRLRQARPELLHAIECKEPFGHAAKPWSTWATLHDLEQAEGNSQAAAQARKKAIQAYIDYRHDGGENHNATGRLALAVLQAIQQGETAEIEQTIEQYLKQDESQEYKTYFRTLQAILAGERDPALAEDNKMDYDDVAELKILLEQLQ